MNFWVAAALCSWCIHAAIGDTASHLPAAVNASAELFDSWYAELKESYEWLKATRREFHQWPEIGLDTLNTSRRIQQKLRDLGVNHFTTGWAVGPNMTTGRGVVVDFGTGKGPAVLLRADHDALPLEELADVPYRSKIPGRMHACGHDSHTTMLLGVAKLLKTHENEIPGTIRLMFQPGEEGYRGAMYMVNEGVLTKDPKIQYAIAPHVGPWLYSGQIALVPGYHLASAANLHITIRGQHHPVGQPATGADAILAAASITRTLQTIVSREATGGLPNDVLVISVTQMSAAAQDRTLMPDTVELAGTLRAIKPARFEYMRERVESVVAEMAGIYGCEAQVRIENKVPPMLNDPKIAEDLAPLITHISDPPAQVPPGMFVMAAEDFAFVGERVPSAFVWVGINDRENPSPYELHNPKIAMSEEHIPRGAAALGSMAMHLLRQEASAQLKKAKAQ